jgi:hypothetical protein
VKTEKGSLKENVMQQVNRCWFGSSKSCYIAPLNRSILLQKANDFGEKLEDFKATDGWLTRWKETHGIVYRKLHGEKQYSDGTAAGNWLQTDWKAVLNTYSPVDVFNADKTELYYRATPDYSMIFKNSSASSGKKVKDRIIVLLTCNMTGTIKMKSLVIGKSKSLRCFKGVKNLPVEYAHNANAWMTASVFEPSQLG